MSHSLPMFFFFGGGDQIKVDAKICGSFEGFHFLNACMTFGCWFMTPS